MDTGSANDLPEQRSAVEQENILLKVRLQACEESYALLQAEVMRYRQNQPESRSPAPAAAPTASHRLAASEEHFRTLFEFSSEGFYYIEVDPPCPINLPIPEQCERLYRDIRVVKANPAFAAMYGVDHPDQLIGLRNPDVHVPDSTKNNGFIRSTLEHGYRFQNLETEELDRLGQRRYFLNSGVYTLADGYIVGGWGTQIDITELRTTQQALLTTEQARAAALEQLNAELEQSLKHLQTRERFLEVSAIAANNLLTTQDFDRAVNMVLKLIGESLDTDRVTVIEFFQVPSDSLPHWRVLYEWTSPGTRSQMAYSELMQGSFAGTEDILHQFNQGQTVSYGIEDLSEPFRSIQRQLGVQGLYAIPIFVKGLLWGVIGFDDCRAAKQRHAVELSVLKIAADCIGSAIQRQRTQQVLLQAEQQRVAELAQANEVLQGRDRLLETTAIAANTLLSAANFDEAVNTVLQLIGEALDTDRVKVLECIYQSAPYPAYSVISHEWVRAGIIPQISHPSSARISSDGAEDFLQQLSQGDGFGGVLKEWPEVFWEAFEAVEAKAIYCVPIRLEGQIWGFLIFDDCRDVKQRDLSELSVLKIAANCIGNAIQRQRTQQALIEADNAREAAILEERNRMAGEIHDTLAQAFTGISLQVEVAKPLLGQSSPAVSTILDHLQCLAETGLAEARRSVWALYPPAAEYAELAQLLYESVEYMSRNTATQIEVNVDGPPGPLPPFLGMNLLRIGQEALTNALKHAQAQTITIDLTYEDDRILLQICDDGMGFVPPRTLDPLNGGFGLVGMYERCDRIGAQLSLTSTPGQGTQILVEALLSSGETEQQS
ncbi:GAF domain-containing protein [Halomicronema sp. CCY15110]|uniref:GAF domain-containing protein n=1 Tax=Halomicronema sp. CCY15110 TaxID=2767773 RepID=UPI001952320D|nr:GAF domain-containing protein [Halomicronema sp. CCY15110]